MRYTSLVPVQKPHDRDIKRQDGGLIGWWMAGLMLIGIRNRTIRSQRWCSWLLHLVRAVAFVLQAIARSTPFQRVPVRRSLTPLAFPVAFPSLVEVPVSPVVDAIAVSAPLFPIDLWFSVLRVGSVLEMARGVGALTLVGLGLLLKGHQLRSSAIFTRVRTAWTALTDKLPIPGIQGDLPVAFLETTDFLHRTLFDQSPVAIAISKPTDRLRILRCNQTFQSLFGYTEEEIQSIPIDALLYLYGDSVARDRFRDVMSGRANRFQVERLATRKDGTSFWARVTISIVRSPAGEPEALIRHFEDCTVDHELREELRHRELHYRLLAEHASDVTLMVEFGTITYASPSTLRVLGYEPDAIIGQPIRMYIHPDDVPLMDAATVASQQSLGRTLDAEYRIRHADGSWRVVEAHGKAVDFDGSFLGYLNLRDVTERRAMEQQILERELEMERLATQLEEVNRSLQDLAVRDSLTGVFNRRGFDDHLTRAWSIAAREHQPVGLLMIDVDHFKAFNDTYGHPVGDGCLKQIADTIVGSIRAYDVAARHGGEEFAVILPSASVEEAAAIAERVRLAIDALQMDHESSPVLPWVTVSVGVASLTPGAFSRPTDLVGIADAMLYTAKQEGRNRVITAD